MTKVPWMVRMVVGCLLCLGCASLAAAGGRATLTVRDAAALVVGPSCSAASPVAAALQVPLCEDVCTSETPCNTSCRDGIGVTTCGGYDMCDFQFPCTPNWQVTSQVLQATYGVATGPNSCDYFYFYRQTLVDANNCGQGPRVECPSLLVAQETTTNNCCFNHICSGTVICY